MLGQLVGSCWNEGKMRHGWKSCKSILGSLAKQGNCEVQTAARLGLINRISTTHIKEGQPRGNYHENQKEKQVHVCGELDFSCPKDRTVPPNSPAQGMQADQFCAPPGFHPAPAAWPGWHLSEQHQQCLAAPLMSTVPRAAGTPPLLQLHQRARGRESLDLSRN